MELDGSLVLSTPSDNHVAHVQAFVDSTNHVNRNIGTIVPVLADGDDAGHLHATMQGCRRSSLVADFLL